MQAQDARLSHQSAALRNAMLMQNDAQEKQNIENAPYA